MFYTIEVDPAEVAAAHEPARQSQKIEPVEKDEIRELFYKMRDIHRQYRSPFTNYSRFFDRRAQRDEAKIFYKQAVFMKDFEDDYPKQVPFTSYYPYYQMLGYDQLRTYFTWRTQARKGVVNNTSLSYFFLYAYELLNNVGVDSPQDGLDKLMFLQCAFKAYDDTVDKYTRRWLKDYHIYYDVPGAVADVRDSFGLYCGLSKYDIRKSAFFTENTSGQIEGCFHFVMDKIRQGFGAAGIRFDDVFFRPTKKITAWKPFKDALFHERIKQRDRRIVVSEKEIYICSKGEWIFSTAVTTEKGRQFIGYVMKKMESVLRKATKYKYKIAADIDMVHPETLRKLTKSGIDIEKIVQSAVLKFYREATKTVVTVDNDSLARIRLEALATQEALIVEEQTDQDVFADSSGDGSFAEGIPEPAPGADGWGSLKGALSESELRALTVVLRGGNLKQFADESNIMLEVLADGINEKAADFIGDNLLDDDFAVYEDYIEQIRRIAE